MDDRIYIGMIQFIVLLLSLSVHETAHAWTASALGDPTARYLGRVSLNPIVHADLFGTVVFPIIGLFSGFMFGWAKPVPVNVGRLRNPERDYVLVAAAGPVSNVLLAAGLFAILMAVKLSSPEGAVLVRQVARFSAPAVDSMLAPLAMVAFYGIIINIILAVFNMIPVAPLDGAAVLSGILPKSLAGMVDELQNYGFAILILLLFMGIPSYLYSPVLSVVLSFLVSF